jgi:hypothetical protein
MISFGIVAEHQNNEEKKKNEEMEFDLCLGVVHEWVWLESSIHARILPKVFVFFQLFCQPTGVHFVYSNARAERETTLLFYFVSTVQKSTQSVTANTQCEYRPRFQSDATVTQPKSQSLLFLSL